MARLKVEAEGVAIASPTDVWALVADASSYAEWGPWDGSGDKDGGDQPSGTIGTMRWLRYRNTTTVELVLDSEPNERLVYSVLRGIPVRNYEAQVTITPIATGTHVRWAAEWDRTIAGRIVQRKLRALYPEIMARLLAAAERRAITSRTENLADYALVRTSTCRIT